MTARIVIVLATDKRRSTGAVVWCCCLVPELIEALLPGVVFSGFLKLQALSLQSSKSNVVSVSTSSAVQRLQVMAVRCCLQLGNRAALTQALGHLEQLTEGGEEADVLQAYVFLALNDQDQLQGCVDRLQGRTSTAVTALTAWLDLHHQRYTEATAKLQQCVREDPSNVEHLLMLGRALWERRGEGASLQEHCFNTLLKAAKLDPYMSGTFLYLGHFYAELKKDQQRAKKCYQKAYDLDADNEEAGAALCDLIAALGEEESVQNLLQKVTDSASAGCAKWAWLRLGLAQVRTGDPSTATASFQSALRADPTDRHVWECLAEAYLHRGSFTAALKAFSKAVELYPDSIYCLYQLASIKQTMGALTEALQEYSLILDKTPHYVPALKGLGETYLLITQRHLSQGLLGLAVDTCQQALTCLTRSATHRPDLSCLWKLLGDCCTLLHPLHSPSFRIEVPRRLCQASSTDSTDSVALNKAAFMELGTKCYGRALKILPDSAPLWHDLGLSLFYLGREVGDEEGGRRREVVERSVRSLKKALTLDPSHHRHWTALGVVAASPYVGNLALAQHCFIKSVQCEANNAVAWTNLGTLYLRSDSIQLAHEAFKVAQSQDPEYLGSWVGQALVAEVVGHEEAMDLFRHTTQLGIQSESCSGYGHWVISTLLDVERQDSDTFRYCIHQMAAVPAAADALTRYTEVKKDDPRAFNMLGLLLEHQELFQSALTAFRRAAELGEKGGLTHGQCGKVQLNMARLLSKNGQYMEAVGVYQSCAETFGDVCQWALALYRAGQLQDSCQVYEKALSMAESDSDRSDVWAAMGMVAYRAGNKEDAKSSLFQSFQLSTPSLQGLLALCALGVLQRDVTLTQATLQELSGLAKGKDKLCDVATLTAAFHLSQGEGSEALDKVEAMLKENGTQAPGLHLLMARLALHTHSGHTAMAAALGAPRSPSSSIVSVKEALLCVAMAQLHVGQHSRQQPADNALSMAQKAFHCRPDDVSALCCLASAVHAEGIVQFVTQGNTALLTREVGLLDLALTSAKVTGAQAAWCLKQKAVTQLMVNDVAGCHVTLQQLQASSPQDSDLAAVLQCVLDDHQAGLEPLVLRDAAPLFHWQVLLCGLVREERWKEAGVVVREALQRASSHSGQVVRVVCLLTMAWLAAQQLLGDARSEDDNSEVDRMVGEVEEACEAVNAVSQQPFRLTQVLLALVHRQANPRKAKHHFANTLEEGRGRSCLGVEVSLARRGILAFLHGSGKDTDLVQKLLSDAEVSGDMATTELYQKLSKD
ncbi:tetratricopeptide repeat protein 37-like [Babylonia areolata]|uniref:tetratricopeptide repeat protein 37-like n=1 Tax=Babylonia areolata TaxID=304850 RepID=UPI003FD12F6D